REVVVRLEEASVEGLHQARVDARVLRIRIVPAEEVHAVEVQPPPPDAGVAAQAQDVPALLVGPEGPRAAPDVREDAVPVVLDPLAGPQEHVAAAGVVRPRGPGPDRRHRPPEVSAQLAAELQPLLVVAE